MVLPLPSAEAIILSSKIDLLSCSRFLLSSLLKSVADEVRRYEAAMKAEIEPLFGDNANEKTKFVIETVTGLYDELFEIAKSRGANDEALSSISDFIETGMTTLVHEFSGYFDDDVKDLETFLSLFEIRKNEAIWAEVFTFYFNFRTLTDTPASLVSSFVAKFWDCWLVPQRLGQRPPYHISRLSKILDQQIYGVQAMDIDGTKHYNTKYVELFEQYSRSIAEKSSLEKRDKILRTLKYQNLRLNER